MPESRLARTREAYLSRDPIQSLARVYLQHASGLIRDGRASEAVETIDEAARILGVESPMHFIERVTDTLVAALRAPVE